MAFEKGNKLGGNKPKSANRAAMLARQNTEGAINALIEALADEKTENRIKAAESLLNRGWGKPQEFIEHSSDPDEPLTFRLVMNKRIEEKDA